MLEELIDPKMDFVFKYIFGQDKESFMSFANSVLKHPESKKIKDINFLNNEINKDTLNDKESRLDVHAILADGSHITIEMQMQNTGEYIKRSLYYWAKLFEGQLQEGDPYKNLNPAICINVLNFSLFKEKLSYHSIIEAVVSETKIRFSNDLEIHFIELPKAPKKYDNTLEKWMHFLKNPSQKEVFSMGDKTISNAFNTLEYLSQDPEMRAKYEARRKYEHDYVTAILTATEEGIRQGIETGVKKGKDEGREEGKKSTILEIAHTMRTLGLPLEVIRKATGLSYEEIENLIF